MLVSSCEDLHHEYTSHLKCQKDGPKGMVKWSADRSNSKWYQTLCACIKRLMGPETIEILRLTKFSSHVFQFDHVNLPPEIENESLLLNEYGSLMLGLVCQRAWSQVHFGLVFPYCLSRILSHEQAEKNRAQNLLRSLCRGILDLEEAAEKSHEKSPLRKLLRDVGTNNWVIVRELFVHGISVDWRPEDPELRAMAFSLAAGPTSTKYCLENVLSSVKGAGARVPKNTKNMGLFSKWMYAATSHHAPAGGVEQIQVERDDLLQVPFKQQSFGGKQTWEKGAVESFRQIFPSAEQILNEIRKAGYHANKEAASASAYILNEHHRQFANVGKAWAGVCSLGFV